MNILSVNGNPKQHDEMVQLLQAHTPVYGVEFTLAQFNDLLTANIDGQHNPQGGKSAIKLALSYPLPPEYATYAVNRPDPDALGAICMLEMRRDMSEISEAILQRVAYIDTHDTLQHGAWPGPQDPATLDTQDRLLFNALSSLCMNPKVDIRARVGLMAEWLETGHCDSLKEAIAQAQRNTQKALTDTRIVSQNERLVALEGHTMGATAVGYCYAPAVILKNDAFMFPGTEGIHLKYTICQFEEGKYLDLPAVAKTLDAMEDRAQVGQNHWGGSPGIIGSPQGVSSSLTMEQIINVVQQQMK